MERENLSREEAYSTLLREAFSMLSPEYIKKYFSEAVGEKYGLPMFEMGDQKYIVLEHDNDNTGLCAVNVDKNSSQQLLYSRLDLTKRTDYDILSIV